MGLAAAVVGASVIGAGASLAAGSMQAGAAKKSANTQLQMYNQTRADLLPYMNAGTGTLPQIQNLLGNGPGGMAGALAALQNYPGYQWAFGQGQQAVDRSGAARGMLLSGGQLKDLTSYGQGMADQLMNQYFGQLMGVATMGENAAAMTGQQGTAAANAAGASQIAAGNANAAGLMGATNAIFGPQGAFNSAAQAYQLGLFGSPGSGAFSPIPDAGLSTVGMGDLSLAGGVTGASGYGYVLSDRRAKADVEKIGRLDSGLPVYKFRYKGSRLPQIGVMAQDVERVSPSAVREDRSGLKRVDMAKVAALPRRGSRLLPVAKEAA